MPVFLVVGCKDATTGTYYVGSVSVDDVVDYGTNMKTVRGSTTNLSKFEPFGDVREDGKFHQSRMSNYTVLDANGYIPAFVVNSLVPGSLSLADVLLEFNNDEEIDRIERSKLVRIIENSDDEVYSGEEVSSINHDQHVNVARSGMFHLVGRNCASKPGRGTWQSPSTRAQSRRPSDF